MAEASTSTFQTRYTAIVSRKTKIVVFKNLSAHNVFVSFSRLEDFSNGFSMSPGENLIQCICGYLEKYQTDYRNVLSVSLIHPFLTLEKIGFEDSGVELFVISSHQVDPDDFGVKHKLVVPIWSENVSQEVLSRLNFKSTRFSVDLVDEDDPFRDANYSGPRVALCLDRGIDFDSIVRRHQVGPDLPYPVRYVHL